MHKLSSVSQRKSNFLKTGRTLLGPRHTFFHTGNINIICLFYPLHILIWHPMENCCCTAVEKSSSLYEQTETFWGTCSSLKAAAFLGKASVRYHLQQALPSITICSIHIHTKLHQELHNFCVPSTHSVVQCSNPLIVGHARIFNLFSKKRSHSRSGETLCNKLLGYKKLFYSELWFWAMFLWRTWATGRKLQQLPISQEDSRISLYPPFNSENCKWVRERVSW